jgi:predicted amidohydrolase
MDTQGQKQKNLQKASSLVREAVSKGARLVGLPECFNFVGDEKDELKQAEPIPGPTTLEMSKWAKDLGIWLHGGSILERVEGKEKAFNTTVFFDPRGNIVATYRKIHLFDVDMADGTAVIESRSREPGDEITNCPTAIGSVGLTICYDLRFCEIYRILALKGAQMVFVPAMFTAFTGKDHWEPLIRTRAIENQFFVLAPAQIGEKPLTPSHGHTMIVDPWGTLLAEAIDGETAVVADLDLARLERIRQELPSLKNRRPAAYHWPK